VASERATTQTVERALTDDAWVTAIAGIEAMLRMIGRDTSNEGIRDTPLRVVKAFAEMTAGYRDDPKQILGTVFVEPVADEMIVLRDVEFVSLCEHHLLPFTGVAHIGYLPAVAERRFATSTYRLVGLSKLARLVECFARRLQVQERMTGEIAQALQEHAGARGVGVVVRATHSCMALRGIKKNGATMTTSAMLGALRDDSAARAEFMRLID